MPLVCIYDLSELGLSISTSNVLIQCSNSLSLSLTLCTHHHWIGIQHHKLKFWSNKYNKIMFLDNVIISLNFLTYFDFEFSYHTQLVSLPNIDELATVNYFFTLSELFLLMRRFFVELIKRLFYNTIRWPVVNYFFLECFLEKILFNLLVFNTFINSA